MVQLALACLILVKLRQVALSWVKLGKRRENSQNAFKPSARPVERLLGFKGTLYRVSP